MPQFSKEEMFDELRTIFLFEADHILLSSGEDKATAFIGFPPGDAGEYCHQSPSRVDLSLFSSITHSFDSGYDLAFRPSVICALGEGEVQDLMVFMDGTPRTGGISSGGEGHRFMTPDGYCQTVTDTVFARWKLEWDQGGDAGHTFTTRDLALLASMTEGAVRNALSDKSENGLKAIPGSKPVSVEHAEALRWLAGRRGFVPWANRPGEDRFLTENFRELSSAEAFGKLISRLPWALGRSSQKAAAELGWTVTDLDAWYNGSFIFDASRAVQLGSALGMDVPLFAGKALEVALRRDGASKAGDQP